MKKYKLKTNSKYNGIVKFLACLLTILFMLGIPALLVYSIIYHNFIHFILWIPCGLVNLFIVWGLDNALTRINLLENILSRKINLSEEDYIIEITGKESKEKQSE